MNSIDRDNFARIFSCRAAFVTSPFLVLVVSAPSPLGGKQKSTKYSQSFSMASCWWQPGFRHSGIRITLTKAHVNRRQSARRFLLLLLAFPSSLSVDLQHTSNSWFFFSLRLLRRTKQRCELTSQKPLSPCFILPSIRPVSSSHRHPKTQSWIKSLQGLTSHTNEAACKAPCYQVQHSFRFQEDGTYVGASCMERAPIFKEKCQNNFKENLGEK